MSTKERKGYHQKLKLLYLSKIFHEETDDQHSLTMSEIIDKLAGYGVNADRRTLYHDFEELRDFGLDIISEQIGRSCYYHLGNRDFELPELKLLVDSVQAAKFITDKKSRQLIGKIEALASKFEAGKLHRQIVLSGRVKTINKSVFYNIDKIHEAINSNLQIRFQYCQWNLKKQMELRKDGTWYQVSPWALILDDKYYYLAAYDPKDSMIKHFRVDKMVHPQITQKKRTGQGNFKNLNLARYENSMFGMNTGDEEAVTLIAANHLAGILLDRFGKEIPLIPIDNAHFKTTVNVVVCSPFLGWIMSLGEDIKIDSPDSAVAFMAQEAQRLAKQYPLS